MKLSLIGKTALITGAGGHLGRALALGLAQSGALVLLNGRTVETLESVAQEVEAQGGQAEVMPFDVTIDAERTRWLATLEKRHGRLDVLVNNAYHGHTGTVEDCEPQRFQASYEVVTTAAFGLIRSALPLLARAGEKAPGGASIINIASMYGMVSPDPRIYQQTGMNSPPDYGAAKAGLLQLTRYLACHLAPRGIRVNAVSPGPFPPMSVTERWPDFERELSRKTPLGRIGRPTELVGPVVFLASDAASYVTGVNLPVDGGWTAW